VRRVEWNGVYGAQLLRSILHNTPQHGVDQPRIACVAPIRLHEPHRQIDRRMVWHIEPEDLDSADAQRGLDPRRTGRDTAIAMEAEQMAPRATPSQYRRDQPARQRAAAFGQRSEALVRTAAVKLVVERPAAPGHTFNYLSCDPACRKALRFRRW